ncbi:hypothetical protein [Limobrevibacterium gyesilva]|uniref:Uncharacterized protein n=1 Tax=Limobrevibacterium gyesilva TaxID=2991712 RepID=A0AA41YPF4_9PROT|nr:hypothetical protein [Limobrevibacterium gyesilva]MCW3476291.1 hypothetical protein [Limobrevibacterium gyesilva]
MPLTREFKELLRKRIACDPAFGDALLREIDDAKRSGDIETAKAISGMAA